MTRLGRIGFRNSDRNRNEFGAGIVTLVRVSETALAFDDDLVWIDGLDFFFGVTGAGQELVIPGDKPLVTKIHDRPGKSELVQVNT